MRIVKGIVVMSVVMCLFGSALLYAEEGLGSSSLDAAQQDSTVANQEPLSSAPAALTPVPDTTTAPAETASAVAPAAPEAVVPAPAATETPSAAAPAAVEQAPAAVTPAAPAVPEQPAYTPPPSAPEEKKEEPTQAEKPKKKEKKVSKKADLAITKVIAKPAGDGMVEVVIFVKNKGSKKAQAKEGGSGIRLAVRPEGDPATRDLKVGDEMDADKVVEFSIGAYPKDAIEGKNIFVMVSYDGKEDNKSNNVWNKPAKMKKK